MVFQLNHLKKGKHSNALVDFKLEILSPSPSKIDGSCLIPQRSNWRNITEKIKYPNGVDEEFVKTTTLISMG
jgi:hypothetical protein